MAFVENRSNAQTSHHPFVDSPPTGWKGGWIGASIVFANATSREDLRRQEKSSDSDQKSICGSRHSHPVDLACDTRRQWQRHSSPTATAVE